MKKIITKSLAPAAIVMMLGTGAAPAFAANGNAPLDTERVSVVNATEVVAADVNVNSEVAAPINTITDAKIAAESYTGTSDLDEVTKVAKKAASSIEESLAKKSMQKKVDAADKAAKKEAKKQAAAEKAAREAAERIAVKVAEQKRIAAEKAAARQAVEAEKVAVAEAKKDAAAKDSRSTTADRTIDVSPVAAAAGGAAQSDLTTSYDFSDAPVATSSSAVVNNAPGVKRGVAAQGVEKPSVSNSTGAKKNTASSSANQKIAAAAMAQLGKKQDCTMLVTNALKSVGINHHGWPVSYKSLGSVVSASQAQPGDLIYYPDGGMGMAHIAVYIGGGKAVHGGWNGNDTAISSANVGSGAQYIRVNA